MNDLYNHGIFRFGERPIGSENNQRATDFVAEEAVRAGFRVQRLPFMCTYWQKGASRAERGGMGVEVCAGPYSPALDTTGEIAEAGTLDELKALDCEEKILLVHGVLAREPLAPRDFPFYYPDEHKAVYETLDEKKPAAVVAVTGPHPSCGLNPFPWIEDETFALPSAFLDEGAAAALWAAAGPVRLRIDSRTESRLGEQIVAMKKATGSAAGKIVICAHMDTAYGTPGALDNASGVAVLLNAMEGLKDYAGPMDLEFVPFNGEDSGGVKGELAYLAEHGADFGRIRLVVNIDSPGSKGSTTHVSAYNLDDPRQAWLDGQIARQSRVARGPEWVEGDHSIFAFQGVPALAVTSSDLRERIMKVSHTLADTPELVDFSMLEEAGAFVTELVRQF